MRKAGKADLHSRIGPDDLGTLLLGTMLTTNVVLTLIFTDISNRHRSNEDQWGQWWIMHENEFDYANAKEIRRNRGNNREKCFKCVHVDSRRIVLSTWLKRCDGYPRWKENFLRRKEWFNNQSNVQCSSRTMLSWLEAVMPVVKVCIVHSLSEQSMNDDRWCHSSCSCLSTDGRSNIAGRSISFRSPRFDSVNV